MTLDAVRSINHVHATLDDVVRRRAAASPNVVGYVFLDADGRESSQLTYGELDLRARRIGAALQRRGATGERVLLLYPSGLDYVAAFVGCLYAGAVAVPVAPPTRATMNRRVRAIAADSQPVLALTLQHSVERLEDQVGADRTLGRLPVVGSDQLADGEDTWREPGLTASAPALLQYTSGSTANPRGVIVTHGNLLHNQSAIQAAFRQRSDSVIVSWLPLFHDMGLIGGVLQPLHLGARCILMSPTSFLQRPARWLQAIAKYQATTSGGPDFAYELCARKIADADLDRLDLSRWTVAFNGSEPVRSSTLDAFATRFARCGFRRDAFYPCYGLAESTLLVSAARVDAEPHVVHVSRADLARNEVAIVAAEAGGRALVSCGRVGGDQRVAIVDPPTGVVCESSAVGEIWVCGDSVAHGYWNNQIETARVFGAVAAGDDRAFVRTGDLGFFHGGELYITGRLKDTLIVRGGTHYPEDVEATARESHPGLGVGAAFAIDDGHGERVVLVQEQDEPVDATLDEPLFAAIRVAVADAHGLPLYAVALTQRGTIPRTTSGKVQRGACRGLYEAGQLAVRATKIWSGDDRRQPIDPPTREAVLAAAPEAREALVRDHLRRVLASLVDVAEGEIDLDQTIVGIGLDSVMAAALVSDVERTFGVRLDLAAVLASGTGADLAVDIATRVATAEAPAMEIAERIDTNEYPLSSDQERLWLATRLQPKTSAFHLQAIYRIDGPLRVDVLERSLNVLVGRHASLRTTIPTVDGRAVQLIAPSMNVALRVVDAPPDAGAEASAWLSDAMEEERQRPFDLAEGPLLRVSLVRLEAHRHVLGLTVHHIISDAWSLGVFATELARVYAAEASGQATISDPLPAQFVDFVLWQKRRDEAPAQRDYWRQRLDGAVSLDLPVDRPRQHETTERTAHRDFDLTDDLGTLRSLARAEDTTIFVVLLATFHVLLATICDQDDIVVGVPVKGRPLARFDDVIGDFARPLPIRLRVDRRDSFRDVVGACRRAVLEAHANADVSYATIAPFMPAADVESSRGSMQAMFGMLPESVRALTLSGTSTTSLGLRAGTGQCDLFITLFEGQTAIAGTVAYVPALLDPPTVDRLVESYGALLRQLARSTAAPLDALQPTDWMRSCAERQRDVPVMCIAAGFTADPVRRAVEPWLRELDVPARIELAPYGQLHQQLLDPASAFTRNRHGVNVVLLRPSDLRAVVVPDATAMSDVEAFAAAVRSAAARSTVPYLVCVCPDAADRRTERDLHDRLAAALHETPRVTVINVGDTIERVHLTAVMQPEGPGPADIPYTDASFAVIGMVLARHFCAVRRVFGIKAIVVDCDQTLWKGVCAEDGPRGVVLTDGHRALHHFLLRQQRAGILLCLCSKNNPADVSAVFAEAADMPLRPEHFAASRVSWAPKADAVRALAEELQLGLESLAFIDDDPVECASVQAALPEVLTLQLPSVPDRIESFLHGVWAFDAATATAEGRVRTRLYAEQAARSALQQSASTLTEFLEQLQLEITTEPIQDDDLERVAELTARTTQFNARGIRRSAPEIQQLLHGGRLEGVVVRVRDRFGDYGLVGCVLFATRADRLQIDTLLLSCRALGRGVEHRMMADLGRLARERGLTSIAVHFVSTARNRPAYDFLKQLSSLTTRLPSGDLEFRFSADRLAATEYHPAASPESSTDDGASLAATPPTRRGGAAKSALLARIASELTTADAIAAFARPRRKPRPALTTAYVAPRDPLEQELAEVVAELLGLEQVGMADDFFALGGHSLTAMQLLARIRAKFGVDVPLPLLFDSPTLAALVPEVVRACQEQQPTRIEPIEDLVAGVWETLFGCQRIDRDASFSALGGDASLAEQAVARLREALGLEVTVDLLDDATTVTALAARIADLQQAAQGLPPPPLRPVPRGGPLPASFEQQRLWFLNELHPDNPFYNVKTAVRLRGGLHIDVLGRALQSLVDRHEALRTHFAVVDGQPVQVIERTVPFTLSQRDVSQHAEGEREGEADRILREETQRPFDLARGPVIRAILVRLADDEHILLLAVHHIVADGWSIGVLVRELTAIYGALVDGRPSPLPPLPLQYADYAVWQREWLQGRVLARYLDYWRTQLQAAPQRLILPTDRPRPPVQRFRGAMRGRHMRDGLRAPIAALAGRTTTTPFMVLLAAFQILLSHLTQQRDFLVATNVANRNRVETESIVGFFINELLLRADLSGDPTIVELLCRVREMALGAYAHQDLPFDRLVAELRPERTLSQVPLCQVMFTLQNAPRQSLELAGLSVRIKPVPLSTTKVDLLLTIAETESSLFHGMEYDQDLFDPATIDDFMEQYELILDAILAHPEQRRSDVEELLASRARRNRTAETRKLRAVGEEKLRDLLRLHDR